MKRSTIVAGLSYLLIILWIYAAGSKLWSFNAFGDQLGLQPIPAWSVPIIKWLLPFMEFGIAALLCFRKTILTGFLCSLVLLVIFTLYIGFGLAHVYGKIPCSCGGILENTGWSGHLVFNTVFIILAFLGWYLKKSEDGFTKQHSIAGL